MEKKIFGLIKKAEELRGKAKYAEALRLFKEALNISRRHRHLDGILDATLAVADISRMTGAFDAAVKNYEEALEACEALGNRLTAADCMVGMGLSLRAIGMWKDSVKFISAARKTYLKESDRKGTAFSLWAEAGALRVAGDIRKAIAKFRESKALFSSIKFKPGVAYALCGLGGTHRIAGKFDDSLKYYTQANGMFVSLEDKFGAAYSHCGIGNAYRMVNNYGEAMKHFKKAERLYGEIGDLVSYSYTLWSVANVYKMEGDFASARSSVRKAERNFRKTKDPRGLIYCDMTVGEIEFMEGKKAAAKRKLLSALESATSHGFRLERCHARVLLFHADGAEGSSRLPECYKALGVNLRNVSIPFNMP